MSGQGGLLVAGGAGAEQHDPAALEREEVYSEEFPQLGRAVTAADLPWPPEPIDPHSGDDEPSGASGAPGAAASTSKQIGQLLSLLPTSKQMDMPGLATDELIVSHCTCDVQICL